MNDKVKKALKLQGKTLDYAYVHISDAIGNDDLQHLDLALEKIEQVKTTLTQIKKAAE